MSPASRAPDIENAIDRLYQVPLNEFVKARTALAKDAGPRAAEIKAIQKPHAAAWAVNQLYWRHRKTYDRLIASSGRARKALTESLGGQGTATVSADDVHDQAVNAAAAQAREILASAGVSRAPATLRLVRETLLALPGQEPPGRLGRPLAPLGFGSLTAALLQAGHAPRHAGTVLPFAGSKTMARKMAEESSVAAAARAREKQAALDRKRELTKLDAELKTARTAAARAHSDLDVARRMHANAERRRVELQSAVETATAEVDRSAAELKRLERVSKEASTTRDQLEYRRSSIARQAE